MDGNLPRLDPIRLSRYVFQQSADARQRILPSPGPGLRLSPERQGSFSGGPPVDEPMTIERGRAALARMRTIPKRDRVRRHPGYRLPSTFSSEVLAVRGGPVDYFVNEMDEMAILHANRYRGGNVSPEDYDWVIRPRAPGE